MKRSTRLGLAIVAVLVLVSAAAGVLLVRQTFQTENAVAPPEETGPVAQALTFQLYFPDGAGTHLASEIRSLPACDDEVACAAAIFGALIQGPTDSRLAAALPRGTALRGVRLENGVVLADFSRELVSHHPGGTLSELLTVYSLADSLAANYPHLRQLRLLVEGEALTTLKGHVDLRQPVVADFQYTRPPVPVPAAESVK